MDFRTNKGQRERAFVEFKDFGGKTRTKKAFKDFEEKRA